ncbi:prolyl 4-hydroxylase subunit alpha-2 [Drosophila bipectinata]|uniref:prolyl 4-hydroxylase subunit alpha-2 n=1 Tax=Drosophila bipectinata TaxID=42026 RepID=UPI001C89BA95|nr:prolyl 4-hydroxylase subunit alpha-2 [Drosophila bipectinata]
MRLVALLILIILFSLTNGTPDKKPSLSVVSMVPLLEMERKLINNLEEYAIDLKQKLQIMESQIASMRVENGRGYADPLTYVSNPLNGLSLIRRLNKDWEMWRRFIQKPVGVLQMKALDLWLKELPTDLDLYGACEGILRIRDYYDLKMKDIIRGNLFGIKYNVTMSVADLYAMGQHLFEKLQFVDAIPLLQEVWQRIREDPLPMGAHLSIEELDVIKLLAESLVQSKLYPEALSVLNKGLQLSSKNAFLLREKEDILSLKKENPSTPSKNSTIADQKLWSNLKESCKGTFISRNSRLKCFFNSSTTPFIRIAPFKMEQVGLDPYVVLFHNVLSPREISALIKMSDRRLAQANTVKKDSFKTLVRTAKALWVYQGYRELTKRISRRIHDMSGLELADAEMFQIINYGIGGHYGKHMDYFNSSGTFFTGYYRNRTKKYLGDRIATVLFYLSDVEQGGATVFPKVSTFPGYTVYPRAGTALMWYNLHTDGIGDKTTMHAACPVIVGSKWVMTQWIRERSQIIVRPCLEPSPSLTPT